MKELETAFALAISMLIFSTLVSMIVEVIFRILRTKGKNLTFMLNIIYEQEVRKRIKPFLNNNENIETPEKLSTHLESMNGGSHTLTSIEFIRRLAETNIGQQLAEHAKGNIDQIVHQLVTRYDSYGAAASERFRSKSKIITTIVSICLALALNINAIELIKTFQQNQTLTESMINNADLVTQHYSTTVEKIAKNKKDNGDKNTSPEELSASITELKNAITNVKELGLPIGWKNPHPFSPPKDKMKWLDIFFWFISTIATGILIGLGAPFWFDLVKRFSAVSQVTNVLTPRRKDGVTETNVNVNFIENSALHVDEFKSIVKIQQLLQNKDKTTSDAVAPKGFRS
ncbi:MAG: hypothetical protein OCD00_02870 [Colwellia sp.]